KYDGLVQVAACARHVRRRHGDRPARGCGVVGGQSRGYGEVDSLLRSHSPDGDDVRQWLPAKVAPLPASLRRSTARLSSAWLSLTTMLVPLATWIPALVVPVVEALGVEPLLEARFCSMRVRDAPPTLRMLFPRFPRDTLRAITLSAVVPPEI